MIFSIRSENIDELNINKLILLFVKKPEWRTSYLKKS